MGNEAYNVNAYEKAEAAEYTFKLIMEELNCDEQEILYFGQIHETIGFKSKATCLADLTETQSSKTIVCLLNLPTGDRNGIILGQRLMIKQCMGWLDYDEADIFILAKREKVIRKNSRANRIEELSNKQAGRVIEWLKNLYAGIQDAAK